MSHHKNDSCSFKEVNAYSGYLFSFLWYYLHFNYFRFVSDLFSLFGYTKCFLSFLVNLRLICRYWRYKTCSCFLLFKYKDCSLKLSGRLLCLCLIAMTDLNYYSDDCLYRTLVLRIQSRLSRVVA